MITTATKPTVGSKAPPIVRWRNALLASGAQGPKVNVRATLLTMSVRADNNSLSFFMTMREVGEWMGVTERTAEKYVAAALASGWLLQTRRGNSRFASEYVLTVGATNNPDGVIPAPTKSNPVQTDGINPVQTDGINPVQTDGPTTPTTTNTTTPLDIRSFASDDHGQDRQAALIPDDWHPHGSAVSHGRSMGIGSVTQVAADFKAWAIGEKIKRSNWDQAFQALLSAFGSPGFDPEEKGYSGIADYAIADDWLRVFD